MTGHYWADGIVIGCDDATLNVDLNCKTVSGSPGIVTSPDRVIKADDFLVFVSAKSTPSVSTLSADHKVWEVKCSLEGGGREREGRTISTPTIFLPSSTFDFFTPSNQHDN
jgi:hypothetical protein